MKNSEIEAIQILALLSVEAPDKEAHFRKICRWYSREFYTPLHIVINELPFEEILQHYYEHTFSTLYDSQNEQTKEKYNEIRAGILYPDLIERKEAEDDDWAEKMAKELDDIQEEEQKGSLKSVDNITDQNPNLIDEDVDISVQGEGFLPEF